MGIDFSHCEAHWAYRGFNRARAKLAAEVGIILDLMEGFADRTFGALHHFKEVHPDISTRMLGWIPEEALSWKHIKDDIVILLNHSDCDGEITAEECLKVAPRLRHLVEDWHEDDFDDSWEAAILAVFAKYKKELKTT